MHTIDKINIGFHTQSEKSEKDLGDELMTFVKEELSNLLHELLSGNANYYSTKNIIDIDVNVKREWDYKESTLEAIRNEISKCLRINEEGNLIIDQTNEVGTIKSQSLLKQSLIEVITSLLRDEKIIELNYNDLLKSNHEIVSDLLFFLTLKEIDSLLNSYFQKYHNSEFIYSLSKISKVNLVLLFKGQKTIIEDILNFLINLYIKLKDKNYLFNLHRFIVANYFNKSSLSNNSSNILFSDRFFKIFKSENQETVLDFLYSSFSNETHSFMIEGNTINFLRKSCERLSVFLVKLEEALVEVKNHLVLLLLQKNKINKRLLKTFISSAIDKELVVYLLEKGIKQDSSLLRKMILNNNVIETKKYLNSVIIEYITINKIHLLSKNFLLKVFIKSNKKDLLKELRTSYPTASFEINDRHLSSLRIDQFSDINIRVGDLMKVLSNRQEFSVFLKCVFDGKVKEFLFVHNVFYSNSHKENKEEQGTFRYKDFEVLIEFLKKENRLEFLFSISTSQLFKLITLTSNIPLKKNVLLSRVDKVLHSSSYNTKPLLKIKNNKLENFNSKLKTIINGELFEKMVFDRKNKVTIKSVLSYFRKFLTAEEFSFLKSKTYQELLNILITNIESNEPIRNYVFNRRERLLEELKRVFKSSDNDVIVSNAKNLSRKYNDLFICLQTFYTILNQPKFRGSLLNQTSINIQHFLFFLSKNHPNLTKSILIVDSPKRGYTSLLDLVRKLNENVVQFKEVFGSSKQLSLSQYTSFINDIGINLREADIKGSNTADHIFFTENELNIEVLNKENASIFYNNQFIFSSIFSLQFSSFKELIEFYRVEQNQSIKISNEQVFLFYEYDFNLSLEEKKRLEFGIGLDVIKSIQGFDDELYNQLKYFLFKIDLVVNSQNQIKNELNAHNETVNGDLINKTSVSNTNCKELSYYILSAIPKEERIEHLYTKVVHYLKHENQNLRHVITNSKIDIHEKHMILDTFLEDLYSIATLMKCDQLKEPLEKAFCQVFNLPNELGYIIFIVNVLYGKKLFYELLDPKLIDQIHSPFLQNTFLNNEFISFSNKVNLDETYLLEDAFLYKEALYNLIIEDFDNEKNTIAYHHNLQPTYNFRTELFNCKIAIKVNNDKVIKIGNETLKEKVYLRFTNLSSAVKIFNEVFSYLGEMKRSIYDLYFLNNILILLNSNLNDKEKNGLLFLKWFNLERFFQFENNQFKLFNLNNVLRFFPTEESQNNVEETLNINSVETELNESRVESLLFLIAIGKSSLINRNIQLYLKKNAISYIQKREVFINKLSVYQCYRLFSFLTDELEFKRRYVQEIYVLEKRINKKFHEVYSVFQVARYIKSLFYNSFIRDTNVMSIDQIETLVEEHFYKVNFSYPIIIKLTKKALGIEKALEDDLKNVTVQHKNIYNEKLNKLSQKIFIANAGVILLLPYLPILFKRLEIVEDNGKKFKDEESILTGLSVLLFLSQKVLQVEDQKQIIFLKILCGIPIEEPIIIETLTLSNTIKDECEKLLTTVIQHWGVLKKLDTDSLRVMFLMREGSLKFDGNWRVSVEPNSYDFFIKMLPWTIDINMLPWMQHKVFCKWGTKSN